MQITKSIFSHYENKYSGPAAFREITAEVPDRETLTFENIQPGMIVVRPLFNEDYSFRKYQTNVVREVQKHGFAGEDRGFYSVSDWFIGNESDRAEYEAGEQKLRNMVQNGEKLLAILEKSELAAEDGGI